jgi:hypothetical protein
MHLDTKNAETPIERHKAVVTALGHGTCKMTKTLNAKSAEIAIGEIPIGSEPLIKC